MPRKSGNRCTSDLNSRRHITIRCTRSRGPRGFFCLQVVRRGPVIVAVIPLEHCLALLVCPTDSHGIRFDQFRILLDRRWQYGRSCRTRGQRAVFVPVRDHRGCGHTGNAAGLSPTQKLWPYRDRSSCNDTYSSHLDGQRNWRRSGVQAARSINYLYRDHCDAIFRNVLSTGNTPW